MALPTTGGSFTRQPDGRLTPQAGSDAPPARKPPPPTHKPKEA